MSDLHAPGEKLLAGIAARDYDLIAACVADDADFRVLTPHRLREHGSAREAGDRYRFWLGDLGGFELLERDVEQVADRTRIHYRFQGRGDPEKGLAAQRPHGLRRGSGRSHRLHDPDVQRVQAHPQPVS